MFLSVYPPSISLRATVTKLVEDGSLQQYAEIPQQKHASGYEKKMSMNQLPRLTPCE